MRRLISSLAVCGVCTGFAAPASAQCLTPTRMLFEQTGDALVDAVDALERERSTRRRGNPSVLLKVARLPMPAGNASQATRDAVQRCVDQIALDSRTREHAQDSVRFVAGEQFEDVMEALRRVERVGLENIDPDARNVLRIRDINYIAYVRPKAIQSGAGPTFRLDMTVDVVSVESGSIRTGSAALIEYMSTIARFGSGPVDSPPSNKLPSGTITIGCGCHGPVMIGNTRPNPQCQSGVDVAQACQLACIAPNGAYAGVQWGARCQ